MCHPIKTQGPYSIRPQNHGYFLFLLENISLQGSDTSLWVYLWYINYISGYCSTGHTLHYLTDHPLTKNLNIIWEIPGL